MKRMRSVNSCLSVSADGEEAGDHEEDPPREGRRDVHHAAAAAALRAALHPPGNSPPQLQPHSPVSPLLSPSPAQVVLSPTWRLEIHSSTSSSRTLLGTGGGKGDMQEVSTCLSVWMDDGWMHRLQLALALALRRLLGSGSFLFHVRT